MGTLRRRLCVVGLVALSLGTAVAASATRADHRVGVLCSSGQQQLPGVGGPAVRSRVS